MKKLNRNLKKRITNLLDTNYTLSMTWRQFLIERVIDKKVFIVYSDGKVGSTSLAISLKRNYPKQFVFHIHHLTSESIFDVENYYQKRKTKPSQIPDNVVQSKFLSFNLERLLETHPVYFFSLVRDPVAAFVSEYCENYPYSQNSLVKSEEQMIKEIVETIIKLLKSDKIQSRLNWFDSEMYKALNFDVYQENFDTNKGYHIYSQKNLLIFKLETLNNQIALAMRDFLGNEQFLLKKGNQAAQSNYYDMYKEIKKRIKLPSETLDNIYFSKYVQYFYSTEEIEKFRQQWQQ